MVKKKKQHYVPQFYLNGFLTDRVEDNQTGYLWVFKKNKKEAFKKSPKNVAFESYFYSFKFEDEELHTMEDILSSLETDASKLFRELTKFDFLTKALSEKYLLGKFICFMNFRTSKAIELFRILGQNYLKSKFVEQVNLEGGIENYLKNRNEDWDPNQFLDSFNKMKILPTKEMSLTLMIDATIKMIPEICVRNWSFMIPESSNRFFITSDHPVLFYNSMIQIRDFMPGYKDKNTDIIFPLFPKLCLYASYNVEEGKRKISDYEIIEINKKIANFCHKYFFSNTKNYNVLFS